MVEVSLTVGKLDASLALLLTKEHHLIEFPTVLLPDGVSAGSIVTIKCEQNHQLEQQEAQEFESVQDEILQLYGTHEPNAPNLRVKNVTQTSAVLEWDPLELGSASVKSLTLYKNGTRLGQVPNPLSNTTTKLSGLPIDTPYEFHLRLSTTAGAYLSEKVQVHTHKMTDLSGITVCIGDIDPSTGIAREDIEDSLTKIGGRPLQTEVAVDTTHFITTQGLGAQWKKAVDSNIPVVRPEWLKACEQERRIVGVRNFYLDADPKFLEQHTFNKPAEPEQEQPVVEEVPKEETADEVTVSETAPEAEVAEASEENGVTEETPVEETPAEETPVEETPVEETPVEETPVEETPVEETPVEETPVEETPAEETPAEETPAEETPAEETPAVTEETTLETSAAEPTEETEATEVVAEEPATVTEAEAVEDATVEEEAPSVEETKPSAETAEPTETAEPVDAEPAEEEVSEEAVADAAPEPETFDDVDINASNGTDEDGNAEIVEENADEDAAPTTAVEPEGESKTQPSGGKKKKNNKKKKGKK